MQQNDHYRTLADKQASVMLVDAYDPTCTHEAVSSEPAMPEDTVIPTPIERYDVIHDTTTNH